MKEISEMTNEELNYAIAVDVMGWEYGDHFITGANSYRIVGRKTTTYTKANNWYPTTDYNQVFQVVEKMRSMGWSYVIGDEADIYYCKFINLYITCSDEADTQQRAICEAALAAVRGYEMNCSKGIK